MEKPDFSGLFGFARLFWWNSDPCLRAANWLNTINVAQCIGMFGRAQWHVWFSFGCLVFTIFAVILLFFRLRRRRLAFEVFNKQGLFWINEMARLTIEMEIAEKRDAPEAELDVIEEQFRAAQRHYDEEAAAFETAIHKQFP